ncbi:MAG: DNA polymerase I [Desulfobacterota bacterium]|nr:DNA polymerase I [Thermodesulfobacteriota bacterium]
MLAYAQDSGIKQKKIAGEGEINQKPEKLTEEAEVIFRLAEIIFTQLREKGLDKLFLEIEMPLSQVLARMEWTGVKVDAAILSNLMKELEKELSNLEKKIYYLAGISFNINSPQQLREVLFTKLNLPSVSRTKTGFSTSLEVLNKLAKIHELPALVLEYRSLTKLKSTYIEVLPKLISPATGRIHTTFGQTATATGRLSSSNPNLQNIPIRGKWGEKIRQAFVADEGFYLVSADYSQIELRIMAHLSGDEKLKAAFFQDEDIHTRTASEIFQIPPEKVTPAMRREAKVINFGVIYGMTQMGLAEELGISRTEAKKYIENYFQKYAGVKNYIDTTLTKVREQGYTTTIFGRIRYLPEIDSPNRTVREFAERVAINTPIQGSAADIIKIAMLRIDRQIREKKLNARMILQIHDELLFEVNENNLSSFIPLIKEEMEGAVNLNVPIKAKVGFGKNWYEAH